MSRKSRENKSPPSNNNKVVPPTLEIPEPTINKHNKKRFRDTHFRNPRNKPPPQPSRDSIERPSPPFG